MRRGTVSIHKYSLHVLSSTDHHKRKNWKRLLCLVINGASSLQNLLIRISYSKVSVATGKGCWILRNNPWPQLLAPRLLTIAVHSAIISNICSWRIKYLLYAEDFWKRWKFLSQRRNFLLLLTPELRHGVHKSSRQFNLVPSKLNPLLFYITYSFKDQFQYMCHIYTEYAKKF